MRLSKMLLIVTVVSVLLLQVVNCDNAAAFYHCADVGGQQDVSIDQLMGLWYGVEIISHREDRTSVLTQKPDSCLLLSISEDTTTTTITPSYINYNNGQNYGSRYSGYDTTTTSSYEQRRNQERYRNRQHYKKDRQDVEVEQRKLNILWFENDENVVKYTTSYMSSPGVWHISGPHNGSSLIDSMDSFAGTIQVLKAVGDHLVLTFCHKRPDPQLYTVILSRQEKLRERDVLSVHNMLTNKALKIVSIKKVCLTSSSNTNVVNLLVFVLVSACSQWL